MEELIKGIKLVPIKDTLKFTKISDEEYFSAKYGSYISNSRLGLLNPEQDGTPEKFFQGFSANKIFSDSLVFGSLLHQGLLQPEYFDLCTTVDRPTGKVGHIADLLSRVKNPTEKDFMDAIIEVDYYHGIVSEKRLQKVMDTVLKYLEEKRKYEKEHQDKEQMFADPAMRNKYISCLNNLQKDSSIMNLLSPKGLVDDPISYNEQAMIMDVKAIMPDGKEIPLSLKSKLDNCTIDLETNTSTINDLKTTSPELSFFSSVIDRYHYYRELSMYAFLLSTYVKEKYNTEKWNLKGNFLLVHTKEPYPTGVYPMTKELWEKGMEEFKNLLKLVAYYVSTGYSL